MSLHNKKEADKRIEELKRLIEEEEEGENKSSHSTQKFVSTKDKDTEDDSIWARA